VSENVLSYPDLLAWFFCGLVLCVIVAITVLAVLQSRRQFLPHWLMQANSISAGIVLIIYFAACYIAQQTYWMLACAILCLVGAILALALTQPWGHTLPRWLMLLFVWPGGIILTLHALYGFIVQGLILVGVISWEQNLQWIGAPATQLSAEAIHSLLIGNMLAWNPWFLLGGVLFLLIGWQASRKIRIAA
jgi:hypothetical protein